MGQQKPSNWATDIERGGSRKNFNFRVMGIGDDLLRDFVSTNITSTANQSIMSRLMRYQLYYMFYQGNHWKDFNETFISFNYVGAFIDKIIFFLSKEPISFQIKNLETDTVVTTTLKEEEASKSEEIKMSINAEKVILRNWNLNNRKIFTQECLQMGSVFGDAYVVLTYDSEKDYVKFNLLDSRFAVPKRKRGEPDDSDLEYLQVRIPLDKNENEYVLKIMEYHLGKTISYFVKSTAEEEDKYEYVESPLPYDFIPIVHIRNKPNLKNYFSVSDVESTMSLNKVYNEMNMTIKEIIDYHATPTTVITGANAKSLVKGLGRIWSGLPSDAQVFNLNLDSDLGTSMQFTERIKSALHEFSGVPENSLGQLQPISNTSAPALELTHQPLIQEADNKKLMYGHAFSEINKRTIDILKARKSKMQAFQDLPQDFNEKYRAEPVWTYGFPKDRANDLDMAEKEINMGIGSRKEWMEKLGKSNVDELLEAIELELDRFGPINKGDSDNNSDNNSDNSSGSNSGKDSSGSSSSKSSGGGSKENTSNKAGQEFDTDNK